MEDTPQAGLGRGDLGALIRHWRDRSGVSFSVGVPGVVAEFHAMPGAPVAWDDRADAMVGRCAGGTIRIGLADGILPLPCDLPGRRPGRVRSLLFCLPAGRACLAGHGVLREAGTWKGHGLFDIGAGARTLDAMVAVADTALAATLRAAEGERLVGTHHPALATLVEASPARLFRSALAEVHVTQPIARTATPAGPHTHLLPDLIDGSTHDHRLVVPAGWLPCLTMHVPGDDPAWPALVGRFGLAETASGG